MAGALFQVNLKAGDLQALAKAMRAEEDGKALRKDLSRELKEILAPAVADAKSAANAMPSAGLAHDGEPLRAAIAKRISGEVRMTGRATGVRVKARRKGMPRGFEHAPKRTNAAGGWRHPVFGNKDVWVQQAGDPHWFDDALRDHKAPAQRAVVDALDRMRRRIIARVRARGG